MNLRLDLASIQTRRLVRNSASGSYGRTICLNKFEVNLRNSAPRAAINEFEQRRCWIRIDGNLTLKQKRQVNDSSYNTAAVETPANTQL